MAWTDEMVENLKKMWKKGLTTNEIAKNLGVSKNSIVGKVHRLNLTARPSPIKKKEEIVVVSVASTEKNEDKITVEKLNMNQPITNLQISHEDAKVHNCSCLKLAELDNHSCRWPIGDPKDDNFCFCGKKVRSGQTYCEEHSALAYVKPTKK